MGVDRPYTPQKIKHGTQKSPNSSKRKKNQIDSKNLQTSIFHDFGGQNVHIFSRVFQNYHIGGWWFEPTHFKNIRQIGSLDIYSTN